MTRVEEILNWVVGPKVLDVGCTDHNIKVGNPRWLHGQLCERYPYVAGLDISQTNIRQLRDLGFKNLYVQSAESFKLGKKFNTIVAGELVEHLSNPGLFLDRAREHLEEDGRLILTTPFPFSLSYSSYAFYKYPNTCQNHQHTCWFCIQTLKSLVARYDYRIIHLDLIADYPLDSASHLYRVLVRGIQLFSWVLPKRLSCNNIILVAECE